MGVSTTERGLLRLSPRPRLRLTPGWLPLCLLWSLSRICWISRWLPLCLLRQEVCRCSPRLRLMLILTTATTATPGPTPMDTDTVLATEATTGDKFSPLRSANKAEAQSEHHTLLSDLISFSAPFFEVQEIDLSS